MFVQYGFLYLILNIRHKFTMLRSFLIVLIRMRTFLYQWTEGGGKPVTSHLSWSLSPSLTLTSPGLPASILAVGATEQKVLVFRGKNIKNI